MRGYNAGIPEIEHLNGLIEASGMSGTAGTSERGKRQITSADGKVLPLPGESGVTQQELVDAVRDISAYVHSLSRELQFQLDDSSNITAITVTDPETSDVIRRIPTKEVVAIARNLRPIRYEDCW